MGVYFFCGVILSIGIGCKINSHLVSVRLVLWMVLWPLLLYSGLQLSQVLIFPFFSTVLNNVGKRYTYLLTVFCVPIVSSVKQEILLNTYIIYFYELVFTYVNKMGLLTFEMWRQATVMKSNRVYDWSAVRRATNRVTENKMDSRSIS